MAVWDRLKPGRLTKRQRYVGAGLLAAAALGVAYWASKRDKDETKDKKKVLPPARMTKSQAGILRLQTILDDLDVRDFTAKDLTAAGDGKYIPPPPEYLPNVLRVAQLAQRIRDDYGKPLIVSSAYRPWDKEGSAHFRGAAIDLDLIPGEKTEAGEHELRLVVAKHWRRDPTFAGMGFYHQPTGRVHLDVFHPGGKGKRYWFEDEVKPVLRELSPVA